MAEKEYIEREAAIEAVCNCKPHTCHLDDCQKGCREVSAILAVPAADVRPVVHGHNTGNARIFECSICGYGFSDIFLTNEHDYPIDPNFCPNCGAT